MVCRRVMAVVGEGIVEPAISILTITEVDPARVAAPPTPIPGIGLAALVSMAVLIALAGARSLRREARTHALLLAAALTCATWWSAADLWRVANAQSSGAPSLTVSPSKLDFEVVTGGGATPSKSLTVTNADTRAVRITGWSDPAPFVATSTCGSLAPGASCTIVLNVPADAARACTDSPPPTLTSVSPAELSTGSATTRITLVGTGYVVGSVVEAGTLLAQPISTTSTELAFDLPGSMLTLPAELDVSVRNPDGQRSNTKIVVVTSPNESPAVEIVSPASGLTFQEGVSIPITVTSSDADGSITDVELRDGDASIAHGLGGTWNWNWTGAAIGTHTLTAVARDDAGATSTSASVMVKVEARPTADGTLTITSPKDGDVIDGDTVDIEGVTDKIKSVSFPGDCRAVTFADGRFQIKGVALSYGLNQLKVVGIAEGGARVETAVSVENRNARIAIDSLADGAVVEGPLVSMAGWFLGPEGSSVKVQRADQATAKVATLAGMRFQSMVVLKEGSNAINVTLALPDARTVSRTITVKRASPSLKLAITSPHAASVDSNAVIEAREIDVTGTFSAPAGSTISVNGVPAALDGANFHVTIPTLERSMYAIATLLSPEGGVLQTAVRIANLYPHAGPVTTPTNTNVRAGPVLVEGVAYGPVGSAITINGLPVEVVATGATNLNMGSTANALLRVRRVVDIPEGPGTVSLKVVSPKGSVDVETHSVVGIKDAGAPTSVITSPASGTKFSTASITASATAASADSRIERVEWLVDGVQKQGDDLDGKSVTSSFQFKPTVNATYSLVARAIDRKGAFTDSAPVSVTYAAVRTPTVQILEPAAHAQYYVGDVVYMKIAASVDGGTVARVDMTDNASLLKGDIPPPYEFDWIAKGIGPHPLVAKATSDTGGVAYSAGVAIDVVAIPNDPPAVSMVSPADGSEFGLSQAVPLVARASDSDGTIANVIFNVDGGARGLGTKNADGNYAYTLLSPALGKHVVTAVATDDRGAYTESAAVNITVTDKPNVPPVVTLLSPEDGSFYLTSQSVPLIAKASDADGTLVSVMFKVDGAPLGLGSKNVGGDYQFDWSAPPIGKHVILAVATDNRDAATESAAVSITVADKPNLPPFVRIVRPTEGELFSADELVEVVAEAADSEGTVSSVTFYSGDVPISTVATAPYAIQWQPASGNPDIRAVAVDDLGHLSTSAQVRVRVNPKLSLEIVDPLEGATISDDFVDVEGLVTGSANTGVVVNGQLAEWNTDGRFRAANIPLQPGTNEIVIDITQDDGTALSKTISLESVGQAPYFVSMGPTLQSLGTSSRLTVIARADGQGGTVDIDYGADGSVDRVGTLANGTYSAELSFSVLGDVPVRIRVRNDLGEIALDKIYVLHVFRTSEVQAVVQRTWDAFTAALKARDNTRATRQLALDAMEGYSELFDDLGDSLAEIATSFSDPIPIHMNGQCAEFAIKRSIDDETYAFFVYACKGGDGVWRIVSM